LVHAGDPSAGKKLWRKRPEGPGGHQLTTSQQHALAAKAASSTLGCVRRSVPSRMMEVILPLHSVFLFTAFLHSQYCMQVADRVNQVIRS